jgi:hypothetical protein
MKESRFSAIWEIYVVEHPAQVSGPAQALIRAGENLIRLDQPKISSTFAAAQIRAHMALAVSRAAIELVEIFAIVSGSSNNLEVSLDDVRDIFEQECGSLLAFLLYIEAQIAVT